MAVIAFGVVRAIGLSATFVGVMLSLVTLGIGFLIFKISENNRKQYLRMSGLVISWAVFIALNTQVSVSPDYLPILWVYSIYHLFSILVAVVTLLLFLCFSSEFWKLFDHKLLFSACVLAFLGFSMRLAFPFISNLYLSLLQRVVIVIPSMLGLLMILKLYVGKEND